MIQNLQDWAQSFPDWLQWVAIFLIAAIPFVESYSGAFVGVAIGLHPAVAASAAISGNAVTVLIIIGVTSRIRQRIHAGSGARTDSGRRAKLRRLFERFGIPGVSLVGHPTQISSAAMVGFGADRRKVIIWELVSIVFWGSAIAVLAAGLSLDYLIG